MPSLRKLDPRVQWKNPVMFTVYVGAILCSGLLFGSANLYEVQLVLWLWFTVLFANFAEALAESRGKAQADALQAMRVTTPARKLVEKVEHPVSASELRPGDLVGCEAGDVVPSDGEIIEGICSRNLPPRRPRSDACASAECRLGTQGRGSIALSPRPLRPSAEKTADRRHGGRGDPERIRHRLPPAHGRGRVSTERHANACYKERALDVDSTQPQKQPFSSSSTTARNSSKNTASG